MSCSICHASYSFFTREAACPGCGFSCCSKCLKYKVDLPEKGGKKVCGRCFNKHKASLEKPPERKSIIDAALAMEDGKDLDEPMAPVDIQKKLDSLQNPAKPPITVYTRGNHWDKFKKGLEPADQEIVERLRKLKEGETNLPLPGDDEIRRRLAILKDEDPDVNGSNHKMNIHRVDTRTDQQKTDDLLQEYLEQLELTASGDPDKDIEARLRALQGRSQDSTEARDTSEMHDEHHVTKHLISKALAEAALEGKYQEDVDEVMEAEARNDSDEEKPSCVMCEETKNLERCLGCNGDLYCAACFDDNHDEFELHKHKREPATRVQSD